MTHEPAARRPEIPVEPIGLEEAAKIVRVSYALIRRWATRRKITTRKERQPGFPTPRHVIAPEEIERL